MQKRFIIIVFVLSASLCSTARESRKPYSQKEIDSLIKSLPFLKDSGRIDCLNELSEAYHWYNQKKPYGPMIDTAKMYARQALKEAGKINYIQGIAKAYQNLGSIEWVLDKNFRAMEKYFTISLSFFLQTQNHKQIAWTGRSLGNAKWWLAKFSEAIEAFDHSILASEKIHDTITLADTYWSMAKTALESGQYEKSLNYAYKYQELTGSEHDDINSLFAKTGDYETALEHIHKLPSVGQGWQIKYSVLGSTFLDNKQYDSAYHYYQLFLDWSPIAENLAKAEKGEGSLRKLYAAIGKAHFGLKHYGRAFEYLNKALSMERKAADINQVMYVLSILCKAYKATDDYIMEMHTARELLQISTETGARQYTRDAHQVLSEVFKHFKKPDSAYSHLLQYLRLKESIDLDLSAQKLSFYKTRIEREQAQYRINVLKKEKKLQQEQLEQTYQQKKLLIGGIVIIFLIGVVLVRNNLLKRKNAKNRLELAENELKIQKLESEKKQAELQHQATELEMQALRAQMNPHFIFNCLNAINGFILVNESEAAADYLTKFSRLIRMVLNNSHNKIISLDEELQTLRLYLYMERLRFKDNFHYEINCDDTIDELSIFIPPMLLQPFVENAIWHGLMNKEGAGELLIDLHFEACILYCTITDNGVGRKKAALMKSKSAEKNKSMGLEITRKRMALLNQDLNAQCFFEVNDLEDKWGNAAGTRVSLKIRTSEIATENILGNITQKSY